MKTLKWTDHARLAERVAAVEQLCVARLVPTVARLERRVAELEARLAETRGAR